MAIPSYKKSIVLFLDFLGFKNVVKSTVDAPSELPKLIAALNELGRIGDAMKIGTKRVTQFSDSIVVSYQMDERSAAFWILNEIAWGIISLVEHGYLCRGAVTVGDLYHTNLHVVGPAMVEAYEMESRIAKYPRVIVDPKLITIARKYRRDGHRPEEEENYVRSFLTTDTDGKLFVDFVTWQSVVDVAGCDADSYPAYLESISRILKKGLAESDPHILEKYLWLYRRYREALKAFDEEPEGSNFRRSEPEIYDNVMSLPRLMEQADAARKRISQTGP